ncbi:MAG: hypothetical protein BWY99_01894 [Synergistetes bacterium ADurb.BinA166]|nr:MAG: hypothetical protein BWY99_01894 [Synergistetes bacterium ADurb.BinA166]
MRWWGHEWKMEMILKGERNWTCIHCGLTVQRARSRPKDNAPPYPTWDNEVGTGWLTGRPNITCEEIQVEKVMTS